MIENNFSENIIYEDNHLLIVINEKFSPLETNENITKEYQKLIKIRDSKNNNVFLKIITNAKYTLCPGIILFAKSSKAEQRLQEQITNNFLVFKYYLIVNAFKGAQEETITAFLIKVKNCFLLCPQSTNGAELVSIRYCILAKRNNEFLIEIRLLQGKEEYIEPLLKLKGIFLNSSLKENFNFLWTFHLSLWHPTIKNKLTFKLQPLSEYPWKSFNTNYYIHQDITKSCPLPQECD